MTDYHIAGTYNASYGLMDVYLVARDSDVFSDLEGKVLDFNELDLLAGVEVSQLAETLAKDYHRSGKEGQPQIEFVELPTRAEFKIEKDGKVSDFIEANLIVRRTMPEPVLGEGSYPLSNILQASIARYLHSIRFQAMRSEE